LLIFKFFTRLSALTVASRELLLLAHATPVSL
jgi:hypothetical protein